MMRLALENQELGVPASARTLCRQEQDRKRLGDRGIAVDLERLLQCNEMDDRY